MVEKELGCRIVNLTKCDEYAQAWDKFKKQREIVKQEFEITENGTKAFVSSQLNAKKLYYRF